MLNFYALYIYIYIFRKMKVGNEVFLITDCVVLVYEGAASWLCSETERTNQKYFGYTNYLRSCLRDFAHMSKDFRE